MDERYKQLSRVPENALKPIPLGPLKGKSDINPQWRYEALTDVFGLCGIGWRYEVTSYETADVPTGEKLLFVFVNLWIKNGDEWSAPIPGSGGDFIVKKDKYGLHGNDEAFKMAITDALGNAAKMIGVAADVYRGVYNTKYEKQQETAEKPATPYQKATLKALCTATDCPYEKTLKFYHVTDETMTEADATRIMTAVRARETKRGKHESAQVVNGR